MIRPKLGGNLNVAYLGGQVFENCGRVDSGGSANARVRGRMTLQHAVHSSHLEMGISDQFSGWK